jgi:nitrogen fixation NifU-like protein
MLTEMIKGKTLDEALNISDQDIVQALGGLPPTKVHCSILAEKAIQAAVADYRGKKESRE